MISSRVFLPTPRMNRTSPTGRSRSWRTVVTPTRSSALVARVLRPRIATSVSGSAWSSSIRSATSPPPGVVTVRRSARTNSSRQARSISSALSNRRAGSRSQRLAEEGRQAVADRGVEPLGLDRQLVVGQRRVRLAVALAGQDAGGHLVERHAGRVPLGRLVPARRPAPGQERVEVGVGAHLDLLGRDARQREVEQDQLEPLLARADADVVGLDVAVGDALAAPARRPPGAGPRRTAGAAPGPAAPPCGAARPASRSPELSSTRTVRPRISRTSCRPTMNSLRSFLIASASSRSRALSSGSRATLSTNSSSPRLDQQRDARRAPAQDPLDLEAPLQAVAPPGLGRVHDARACPGRSARPRRRRAA